MIILDKPYVSDFLKETIQKNNYPAFTTIPKSDLMLDELPTVNDAEILERLNNVDYPKIYSNSENSIGWINDNLSSSKLPAIINLFKDKILFREKLKTVYPDFYYKSVKANELRKIDASALPYPVILKPAVGFFSMGVYKVSSEKEWNETVQKLIAEIESTYHLYPSTVLNTDSFIIEKFVEGDEYAFDAYFDENGNPVILNIFRHLFSGEDDVGDRVYLSSKDIIMNNIGLFRDFLNDLKRITKLKNFPLHTEVRITKAGKLFPIEINPMRFGGWCTTADATFYSYGINSIDSFFNQSTPDWEKILEGRENKIYSLIVLDNSTGFKPSAIKSFDYEKLLSDFQNPLELRKMDVSEYFVFGFLFCETDKSNYEEIERILHSDLREYVEI